METIPAAILAATAALHLGAAIAWCHVARKAARRAILAADTAALLAETAAHRADRAGLAADRAATSAHHAAWAADAVAPPTVRDDADRLN